MKKSDVIIGTLWIVSLLISWKTKSTAGSIFVGVGTSFLLTLWALIDIARAEKDTGYKIIWALISIFLGAVGATLYYALEARKKFSEIELSKKWVLILGVIIVLIILIALF